MSNIQTNNNSKINECFDKLLPDFLEKFHLNEEVKKDFHSNLTFFKDRINFNTTVRIN